MTNTGEKNMIVEKFDPQNRFNVIESGRGTGKTTFVLDLIRDMALEKDRINILVVWPNQTHISIYKNQLHNMGRFNCVSQFVEFDNGSRVYLTSESNSKNTVGMGFDYIVLDDCQKSETFNRVRPMVADKRGGMLIIGTDVWHGALKHHSKVT